ncbi:hypothetical protein KDH_68220 [Dictyobacter sp. S3.2.2.5]|uniref:Uncharacterized protein n=1 Tax=Dictyobacter halimunensis TaxID=3026934 RepID=A0ABQ6G2E7_9CHLR|nr:hypothetical protein KDH_68220 [Dictyobacter sp. S3.2.2.5]
MSEIIIPGSIICCWIIIIGLAISVARSQRRGIERLLSQLQAWEKAQGVRRKRWEERVEKDMIAMEQRLTAHIDRMHFEDRRRSIQVTERVTYELAHLPRLEDTPLPPKSQRYRRRRTSISYRAAFKVPTSPAMISRIATCATRICATPTCRTPISSWRI